MNILFYYPSIGLGGQQTQIMQLSQALNEMGHSVSWIYSFGDALKEEAKSFCKLKKVLLPRFNQSRFGIFRIINRFLYYNLLEWYLTAYSKKHNIDAIISSNTLDSKIVNRLAKKGLVKHFRLIGGSMVQVEPYWLLSYQKDGVDKYIDGYFGWPAAFDELASQNVPYSKFINFPFAVNTNKFYPLDRQSVTLFRRKIGINDNETVIGWIGRVSLNMQLWDTLKVGISLKERGAKNFKLLFIGGGPDFEILKKRIRENNLEEETILTGWIPYENVNQYINAMDIVPLLEMDPHGGSIVREAMACGRLALSVLGPSKTQSMFMKSDNSILVDYENYLEDAVNRIQELIGNNQEIDRIGRAARDYVMSNLRFKNQAEILIESIEKAKAC